jgi:hypothetical protein
MKMKTTTLLVLCLAAVAGCDDDTATPNFDLAGNPAGDMSVPNMAVRRTADVMVTFQPEGLYWDSPTQTLYIATDAQQIVRWNEQNDTFSVVANLPQIDPKFGGLGALTKAKDGSWLTTRFGFGSAGAVLQVKPDGTVITVGGLDPKRRRIGLAVASDGTVFDGWFTTMGTGGGPMNGTVSKVALDGSGETDVVTGLGKPVGLLVLGDQLYISDQKNNAIVKTPVATPGTTTPFASVNGTDELAAGPNSSILAASSVGTIWQVSSTGTVTSLKDGYKPLRGIAYDGDHKRIIVAEPDAGNADGGAGMPMLHVIPLD